MDLRSTFWYRYVKMTWFEIMCGPVRTDYFRLEIKSNFCIFFLCSYSQQDAFVSDAVSNAHFESTASQHVSDGCPISWPSNVDACFGKFSIKFTNQSFADLDHLMITTACVMISNELLGASRDTRPRQVSRSNVWGNLATFVETAISLSMELITIFYNTGN